MEESTDYLVVGMPRTGSTWLCELLDRAGILAPPSVHVQYESLHRRYLAGLDGLAAFERLVEERLERARARYAGRLYRGFKVILPHLTELPAYAADPARVVGALASGKRIVFIDRADAAKSRHSWARSMLTDSWKNGTRFPVEYGARFLLSFHYYCRRHERLLPCKREFLELAAAARVPLLEIAYEDLLADPQRQLDRVFAFLGAPAPGRVPPGPRAESSGDREFEAFIRRYQGLVRRAGPLVDLLSEGYARFVELRQELAESGYKRRNALARRVAALPLARAAAGRVVRLQEALAERLPRAKTRYRNVERHPAFDFTRSRSAKPPGLSALLRVRDAQGRVPACIESLYPHFDEIVVVDNASGDDTFRVVEGLRAGREKLRLLRYPFAVHAPGADSLGASARSVHSRSYHYNWCLWACRYAQVAWWDADKLVPEALQDRFAAFAEAARERGGFWSIPGSSVLRGGDGRWRGPIGPASPVRVFPNVPEVRYASYLLDGRETLVVPRGLARRRWEEPLFYETVIGAAETDGLSAPSLPADRFLDAIGRPG